MGRRVKSELKDHRRRPAQVLDGDTLFPKTDATQDMLDHHTVIDTLDDAHFLRVFLV